MSDSPNDADRPDDGHETETGGSTASHGGQGTTETPATPGSGPPHSADGGAGGGSGPSRRELLKATGATGVLGGLGFAAWQLFGDGGGSRELDAGPTATPQPAPQEDPKPLFDVWREVSDAVRTSESHLQARADALVEDGTAEEVYELVRDDVVTLPAAKHGMGDQTRVVRWGPRATLRGGAGTMREQAELLAELYERMGYETRLRLGSEPLGEAALRGLLFSPPDLAFDPDVDEETTEEWLTELEVDPVDLEEVRLDENGEESRAVAGGILDALGPLSERDLPGAFDFGGGVRPLVVEATRDGETIRVDPFSPDVGFDELRGSPSDLTEPPERLGPGTVSVSLSARAADTGESLELVSGEWSAEEVAGRQLRVQTLPTPDPVDLPVARTVDVNQFYPALSVQGPELSATEAQDLSVTGEAITRTGDRISFTDDGEMTRNGTPVASTDDADAGGTETAGGGGTSASRVQTLDVEANPSTFPRVELKMHPRDENGDIVSGLGPGAFGVKDNGEVVRPSVVSNQPVPRVMVLYDVSISMPSEYKGENMQEFIEQLRSDIKSVDERAVVEAQSADPWSDTGGGTRFSHLWEFIANAPDSESNLVVFVTDGEALGEKTQERVEQVRNGPRVIGLDTLTANEQQISEDLQEMADLSDGRAIAAQDRQATREAIRDYIDEVQRELPAYVVEYESVDRSVGEHDVNVVAGSGGSPSADTTYRVGGGDDGSGEAGNYGFDRLTLELTVENPVGPTRTVERTIAGDDGLPDATDGGGGADGTTTPGTTTADEGESDDGETVALPDDVLAVEGALMGGTAISFEGWGVPFATRLDEVVRNRMTFEGMHDELAADDAEGANEVRKEEGLGAVPTELLTVQSHYPDAVTEDSLTYPNGLRAAIHHQRPSFLENAALASMDVLPTTDVTTPAETPERRFRLTAERTARAAVAERALFDTAAASALSGADLVDVSSLPGDSARRTAVERVADRAAGRAGGDVDDQVALVDADGEGLVHWQVDPETGRVRGILPDASGGGSKSEEIEETLERINKVLAAAGIATAALGSLGAVSGPGGVAIGAVAAYGKFLVKLAALASISVATMSYSPGEIEDEVYEAALTMVCGIAKSIAGEFIGSIATISTAQNVISAAGGSPPSVCSALPPELVSE